MKVWPTWLPHPRHTRKAQSEAEIWLNSRGINAGKDSTAGTVAVLTGCGGDEVLLHTAKGQVLGKATVKCFGAKPPARVSVKAGVARDDNASIALAMDMVRVTVAKAFSNDFFD